MKKNREQRSLPTTPSVTKKHPALPILKKVGDPTLEVLADYFPLGCSARKCYKVSSQAGKRLTFYQVAEWSNSLTLVYVQWPSVFAVSYTHLTLPTTPYV